MISTNEVMGRFAAWFEEARAHPQIADATVMCLATATPQGTPSARMVLLKHFDMQGWAFFTNMESQKSLELSCNPSASLCFYWQPLGRQIRVGGICNQVTDQEADLYFSSRPRESQIGAWAAQQSRPLESRKILEERFREAAVRYPAEIPRPPQWSGWRLTPDVVEYWQEGAHRLHTRELYTRAGEGWRMQLLYP